MHNAKLGAERISACYTTRLRWKQLSNVTGRAWSQRQLSPEEVVNSITCHKCQFPHALFL